MKRTLVALALFASACGGNSTAPSSAPPAVVPPVATTFTLSGTVTSTAGGPIAGATVRIVDGANAGRSTTTNSAGGYTFTGLSVSGMTVNATATNYVALSRGVTLTSSQTIDFQLTPTPLFARSGVGNTVFDVPDSVLRVRITGTFTGNTSNFVMWQGPQNVACGVTINGSCRLLVNELMGTFWNQTSYSATLLTGATGVGSTNSVSITNSNNVAWTYTEVR